MRFALAALALLALPAAAGETPAELFRLPDPAGMARLVRPMGAIAPPLVILLPDTLGEDGRAEPYVDSLLARGIAKLTLGLGDNLESPTAPVEPAAAPAATGVLGFGLGGRAALTGAEGVPAAALYPGCAGLPDASGTVLILQGDAACPTAPMASPRLLLIPGAGHAWDAPGALWPSPGPLLPDPAGGPRLGARADHAVTLLAAEAIADWFEQRLVGAATPPVIPAWSTRR